MIQPPEYVDWVLSCLVLVCLVVVAGTVVVTRIVCDDIWQKEAITHGAATYVVVDGKPVFKWKDQTND